jgi:hypothetical protein
MGKSIEINRVTVIKMGMVLDAHICQWWMGQITLITTWRGGSILVQRGRPQRGVILYIHLGKTGKCITKYYEGLTSVLSLNSLLE